jgi:hypothetical protein
MVMEVIMFSKCRNAGFEIAQRLRDKTGVLLVFILVCISGATPVIAAEIQSKSYPLAFHVDLRYYLPTSLYIKCDVKEYNMPFPDFLSKENEPRESRFKEIVFAIRNNDLQKCLNMSCRKPGMNEEDTQKHNNKVETWVSAARSWCFSDTLAGENLEKLKVVSQFYLGNSGLFVFGVDANSSPGSTPFRTKLKFVTRPEGAFLWSVENPDALESLLGETMQQITVSPAKFVAVENRKFEYEVPIPDTNDSQHVAYLQFKGEKYDFKVFSDAVGPINKPADEIVSFFQKKYLMVAGGYPRETIAAFYTDESCKKYLDWLKEGTSKRPEYLDWYFQDMATRERTVRFVVDADPLYIVLFKVQGHAPLFHQFIVRDPKDGKLKLANFNCSGFLDDLFNNQKLLGSLSEYIGIK